jgi:S1-C subfamily serine protease
VHPTGRTFVSIGADRLLKVWGAKAGGMARVKPYGFCGIQVGQGAVPGEVVIMLVQAGTPAATSGLAQGDLVRRIGGKAIATPTDVVDQIRSFQEGDEVDFVVERPDGQHAYRIRLGRRPPEVP